MNGFRQRPLEKGIVQPGRSRFAGWTAGEIALSFVCSGCSGIQSVLAPAGPQAAHIESLWWLMVWVSAAVLLLVMLATVYAVSHRRQERSLDTEPEAVPDPEAERKRAIIVATPVGITIIALFGLQVASFTTDRTLASLPTENAVVIDVTGHQWWWEVQYVETTPSLRVTTANEIHIPVGRPVVLRLRSNDVIHSFWVPNLAGKKDLIPGHETTFSFKAERAGVFRGQCAEYCGYQHANMGFLVIAEPPEQFYAWLEKQRAIPPPPDDPIRQHGQEVFLASTCSLRHTIQGTPAAGKVAPDLTHVASRQTIAAATLPNTPGNRAGWIADSQGIKPGNHMPPNPLNPRDFQALLAYPGSLQ
jgi:cytochrome c oxidase subunit 2